ncbi:signal peptidase I [Chloroflexota bacterium]
MKSLLLWLLFLTGVGVAIFAVPLGLKYFLKADEPMMTVLSESMWPILTRGDLIFVKGIDPEDVKLGDVIIFRHGDGVAVHRVVRITKDRLTTKGDANNVEDAPITFDDVVGRLPIVLGHAVKIPFVGRIALLMNPETSVSYSGEPAPGLGGTLGLMVNYLTNPVGFSLLVLLPAFALFGSYLHDIIFLLGLGDETKMRRWRRMRRLQKHWGEARARRALRV